MLKNKLIQRIFGLNRKEMTRFREFVHSPFFNKHTGVQQLVGYLDQIYPKFTKENCHREKIFQVLFPDKVFQQELLAPIFTYTTRLFEQFLIQQAFVHKTIEQELMLLEELRLRSMDVYHKKTVKNLENRLRSIAQQNKSYYRWRYLTAAEANEQFEKDGRGGDDSNLQEKQFFLDKYYFAEKIRDACNMALRSKILKVSYTNDHLGYILGTIETQKEKFAVQPIIYLYYKIYLMITNTDVDKYFEAWDVLMAGQDNIDKEELKIIYIYFQNYCIEQINKGESRFLEEIFKIYQSQLEKELIFDEGYLSEWHYKNIVTTGLRLGQMDWVYQFIVGFKERLEPDSVSNAYTFNLASYYYVKKDLDKVLDLLIKVQYSDVRYTLDSKALLLRTYYDLEEYEALISLVISSRQFLKRNRLLSDTRRAGYSNLFRMAKKAATLKSNIEFSSGKFLKKELSKLKTEMNSEIAIFNKVWLSEKIKELEQAIEV